MATINRVTPEDIYPRVKSGDTVLVCAYDNEETFRGMRLEGAISLQEFKSRVSGLPKDQEIVFYCA
jgi:rhodanese-related sulfurtransferase